MWVKTEIPCYEQKKKSVKSFDLTLFLVSRLAVFTAVLAKEKESVFSWKEQEHIYPKMFAS